MNKLNNLRLYCLCISFMFFLFMHAQFTIGMDTESREGAIVELRNKSLTLPDLTSADKGLGLPRVSLTNEYELYPMFDASNLPSNYNDLKKTHKGLTVYNINPSFKEGECVYTWDGNNWNEVYSAQRGRLAGSITIGNSTSVPDLLVGSELPNCYIVKAQPGALSEQIPVRKAYLMWRNYRIDPSGNNVFDYVALTGEPELEIIWKDQPSWTINHTKTGNSENSSFRIENTGGLAGNALVGVRIPGSDGLDQSGKAPIRWSWHIWFTNYDPDNGGQTYEHTYSTNTKAIFMDRDLGAISATVKDNKSLGLYYQWGRKDPLPGDRNFTSSKKDAGGNYLEGAITRLPLAVNAPQTNNLAYSVMNPTTFISGYDWYTDISGSNKDDHLKQNDRLWDDYGRKTTFDPCPQGWRVPSSNNGFLPWNKYYDSHIPTGTNDGQGTHYTDNAFDSGYNFTRTSYQLGWYPAAGYMSTTAEVDSSSNGIGYTAYRWYANPDQISGLGGAYYTDGQNNSIDTEKKISRSYAASVRCVKE